MFLPCLSSREVGETVSLAVEFSSWYRFSFEPFSWIYRYQSHDYAFSSVEKLMFAIGGADYVRLLNQTLRENLQKAGFSETFLNEMVAPIMRVNFGQSTDLNAFVGAVSMTAADSNLWAVEGGNKVVCSGLLQASSSNLISGSVVSIEEKTRSPTKVYEVVYKTGSETHSGFYDIVLVATPLNQKMSDITFRNFDPPIEEFNDPYQHLVTTFVKGELNSTLFSSRAKDQFGLSTVLVTDDADMFINSLSIVASVRDKEGPAPAVDRMHVWKSFSRDILTKEQISKLFLSYDYAARKQWLSYPHYAPPQKCPSIILHDRLYYLNGIEFAASCMEMSAIAGCNAALLAYHRWNGNEDRIDQDDLYEKLKTEL
ncbi:Prenylcysteine oxidase 1 [Lemmus lemmus]